MKQEDNNPSKIQALIADTLQLSGEPVSPELAFGDLPEWDSMGHMEIMMMLEEQFQIEITAEMISELTSIPAICKYIEETK